SPVGPIRLDVGYNFRGSEPLAVISERFVPAPGDPPFARTGELAVLGPRVGYSESASRFQLHISIGQAF
ncbi:MAG TPA: hypothetical protein VFQ22_10655, partial [Longimicrobiales bacterium]|nr:hypothetical protein [Longimicrobiales bacterium]